MDLTPYLENLRRDLTAAAGPGGAEIGRAAELLLGSLEAATRLTLLEALSEAAAEITTKLQSAAVEVRLRGREADLVVTEMEAAPVAAAPPPMAEAGDVARVTLRLPEPLKEAVERAAAAEGISVNAWLVRAVSAAVQPGASRPATHRTYGRRMTGFAQA